MSTALLRKTKREKDISTFLEYKVPQLKLMLLREPGEDINRPSIQRPEDIAKYLKLLRYSPEEQFVVLHLNVRSQVTGYQIISHGTVSQSLIHPREVFKAAILNNSSSVVLAHNHPSGGLEPSIEDLLVTEQLIAAGVILGISVLDHMIVTFKKTISLRELAPELWAKKEDNKS